MKELIAQYSPDIIKSLIELLVIYLIVRYGSSKVKELKLSEDEVDAIVYDFDPEEIVVSNYEDTLVYEEVKYELADYDIFEIKNDHKEKLNKILIDYGVGACGPRGFYGTLDLHLKLENELAKVYERDSSVLYSNSYTCINSVISCFCKTNDVIFFYKNCSPGILRGISLTKSKSVEFISLLDLKDKIRTNLAPQKNNYLILEGVCELTGEILDLKEYLKLKYDHKIRIILDESNSFPVLGKQGIFTYQNVPTKEVDIIIGSFSNYLCSNGGFVVSDYNIADFQRLSSSSYCFSASLPGVLTEFNYLNLQRSFDFTKLAEKNAFFVERFHNHFLKINSLPDSPFVLISLDEESESRIKQIKIIKFIKDELLKKGVRVGMVEYPIPCLKINIKIRYEEEDLIDCLDILGKIDLPLLSDSEEIDF